MRRGIVDEQALTERQEPGTAASGEEAEREDADKAARQDVEQEAAQELLRTERHHSLLISVGIILPAESNLVMLESHEAVVGDGHAMVVAGEIAEHRAQGQLTKGASFPSPVNSLTGRRLVRKMRRPDLSIS